MYNNNPGQVFDKVGRIFITIESIHMTTPSTNDNRARWLVL